MAQRQYKPFTLFNVRIVDMRHLWSPSDTYKGQKQQEPSYLAGFITPKTQAQWHLEPALAGLTAALGKLSPTTRRSWIGVFKTATCRARKANLPSSPRVTGCSTRPPNSLRTSTWRKLEVALELELQNKVGVKSGDYCMIGGTAAVSGQNNRAAKLYLNAVVFSAPGEEIEFANSVSGAELMQQAQDRSCRLPGFSGAPGFTPQAGSFCPYDGEPCKPTLGCRATVEWLAVGV